MIWLEDHHKAFQEIQRISKKLETIANAFSETGNEIMADTVWDLSLSLSLNNEILKQAVSKHINEEYNAATKRAGQTLNALIDSSIDT